MVAGLKLSITGGNLTMSSREIAELTGKRHDNVMRVCRELKASNVTPQIEELPFTHNGNVYSEFRLNKRDSLIVVAQLCPEISGKARTMNCFGAGNPFPLLPTADSPTLQARPPRPLGRLPWFAAKAAK